MRIYRMRIIGSSNYEKGIKGASEAMALVAFD